MKNKKPTQAKNVVPPSIEEQKNKSLENYKVGCSWNGKLYEIVVVANDFSKVGDCIDLFIHKDDKTERIAMFHNVVYFLNLGPVLRPEHMKPTIAKEDQKIEPKEKTFGEMMDEISQTAAPGELPEGWGKVNGKVF
jgi:hypothetical protein